MHYEIRLEYVKIDSGGHCLLATCSSFLCEADFSKSIPVQLLTQLFDSNNFTCCPIETAEGTKLSWISYMFTCFGMSDLDGENGYFIRKTGKCSLLVLTSDDCKAVSCSKNVFHHMIY